MLALKIGDQSLDLNHDISITLKYASPIFNTIGDYTYPFKIPVTVRNVSILGFKHRIESTQSPYREYDAALEMNGVLLLRGKLRILKADASVYEATLFMDKGDFHYRTKNLSLQDIDFGELTFTTEELKMDYINSCTGKVFPERNICFPQVLNESYYPEPPEIASLHYFNFFSGGNLYYFADSETRSILVPMLYLRFVLKKIFEHIGYTLDDSFFTSDPAYNSMVLFNAVDCNTLVSGYFTYSKLKLLLNYHLPVMKISDFISQLELFFNIRFFVNNVTRTVKLKSVDQIVKSFEFKGFSNQSGIISTEPEAQIFGFHLKMSMDTDDACWAAVEASQALYMGFIKDSVQSLSDLSPWPASANFDIRYVRDEELYYLLYNNVWAPSVFGSQSIAMTTEYIYKQKDKAIETKFSTLINIPAAPFDCAVGFAMTAWRAVSPKLFFGVTVDNGYGILSVQARNTVSDICLLLGMANGLFDKNYKAFLDFQMETKAVKMVKKLTLLELIGIDFSSKYVIGGNKFLFWDVQVTITNYKINPATIRAYHCF